MDFGRLRSSDFVQYNTNAPGVSTNFYVYTIFLLRWCAFLCYRACAFVASSPFCCVTFSGRHGNYTVAGCICLKTYSSMGFISCFLWSDGSEKFQSEGATAMRSGMTRGSELDASLPLKRRAADWSEESMISLHIELRLRIAYNASIILVPEWYFFRNRLSSSNTIAFRSPI
jgi:hypothetical protein